MTTLTTSHPIWLARVKAASRRVCVPGREPLAQRPRAGFRLPAKCCTLLALTLVFTARGQTVVTLSGTRVYDGTPAAAATDLTISNNSDGTNLTLSGSALLAGKDVGLQTILNLGGAPLRVKSATGNSGTNAVTSFSVTLPSPTDGNTLIAVISTRGTSAGRVTSLTQAGAVWARAAQAANANGTTTEIWYAPNVSSAGTSLVVTQASLRSAAIVLEYSGVLTASSLDQTNSATGNNATVFTGMTPTTTQANELWIGGIGLLNSTYTLGTPTNSFAAVTSAQSTNATAGNNAKVYALERVATVTGAAASGATVSTSSQWSGAIATFRAVQAAPPLSLSGSAATNYTLVGATGSMTINSKPLTVTGLSALNKYYDGDTNATLSGTAALQTPEAAGSGTAADGKPYLGDAVSVTGPPVGAFADPAIGNGKPVSVSGLSLTNAQSPNYSLTAPILSANIVPGPAAQLNFGVQPTDAISSAAIVPAVTVRILDGFGNLTTNTTIVILSVGNNPNGGTLRGIRTNAAVNGMATFSSLAIDKAGVGYTLVATAVGLTDTNSTAFNIFAGNPTKLVITSLPQTNLAGVVSSPIVVQMQDGAGNLATSPTNRTINLTTSSAGGVFRDAANTVNVTNLVLQAGTSSTNYLYLDPRAGNPTITNAATPLTSATQTEAVLPAAASQVRVETLANGTGLVPPPLNVTSGASTNLFAIYRDPFGNFVTNDAAVWALTNSTGGVTNSDLVAAGDAKSVTFTGHLAGSAVVQATAPGLSNTVSGTLTVLGGLATKLVITTAPQFLIAGSNSTNITVQIQDVLGNPANTTSNRVVTLTSSSAGAIFRNAGNTATITTVTIPTGSNSTNYLFNATLAGLATITNTTPVLAAATQTEFVQPATASKLIVSTQPSATASAGIAFATQPQVTVKDAFGNTVSGFGSPIAATQTTGGNLNGSLTPPSALPLSGVATFSGLFITNAGSTTLTFSAPGVTGTNSIVITVSPGAATRLSVETIANGTGTVVPAQNLVSGFSLTNYAVARDFYGNFVTNAAVTWSLANVDGGVRTADLVPAANNKSAVFTGRLLGSLNVHITSGGLPATDSGTINIVQGTNEPDLPDPSAHYTVIPAGSWVVPMDNTYQSLIPPFNLKAYGLINRLLQNFVPVSWAIRAGKLKDEADFSAPAFRVFPSLTGTSNLNFAGGPFVIHRDYTNLARSLITSFSNSVAVYQLTADAVVDIRYELQFRPTISVNSVSANLHTNLLFYAGITNYTVTSDFDLATNTCFTLFLEPHNPNVAGVASARSFIEAGGNFLAQCASVSNYENSAVGHFQSTSNIVTDNLPTTALTFANPDLPFSQFVGGITPQPGTSSVEDWTLGGGAFIHNGHDNLDDVGASPAHYAATSSKHSVGRGGMLFYLGGHDYWLTGAATNDITVLNGSRMLLNAVFVPPNRPTCLGINFSTDLAITKSDSTHIVTNGQAVTYTIVVANQGFSQVNGSTVTDTMPSALTNVTWTSTTTGGATNYNPSGTGGINALVDLPLLGSVTFTVHATIGSSAQCLITNLARVAPSAGTIEVNTNNNVAMDVDHVIPPFSAPPDLPVDCATQVPAATTNVTEFIAMGGVIGASAVPTALSYSPDSSNGGVGCPSSPLIISRNYRLTTACGDFSESTQTITVIDHEPPFIQCVADKTVVAGSAWSFDTPTASDGCGTNAISVVVTVTNSLCGAGFVATRTWRATDACGNSSTCNQTVTVVDTSAPAILCVTNKTVELGSAWAFDEPAASHPSTLIIVSTITNATCGNTFIATRTWQAINNCGSFSQCSQTVTVVDTTPPTITCPTNITVLAGAGLCFSNVTFTVTATDLSGPATVVSTRTSGYSFPVGITTVTNVATDGCSNAITCTFTVTVVDDQPPVMICPAGVSVLHDFGTNVASNVVLGTPTVGDNCGIASVISNAPAYYPVGTTFVTWTVVDVNGNSNSCQQQVVVGNTSPPAMSCASNVIVSANSGCTLTNLSLTPPTVLSNDCGGAVVITSNAPAVYPLGTNVVTWTVTDLCGSFSSCQQQVIVQDTTPPTVICSSNLMWSADPGHCSKSNVTYTVTFEDSCSATLVQTAGVTNGGTFLVGNTTNVFVVTDASGNSDTCAFTVTVVDDEKPVITVPTNIVVVTAEGACFQNVTFNVTATDNCAVAALGSTPPSRSAFPVGTNTVTCIASDIHGNFNTNTFTVTVIDDQPPVITCSTNITVLAEAGSCSSNVTFSVDATDNCALDNLFSTPASGSAFPVGTTTVTNVAIDVNGNTSICTFTVIVTDDQLPTLSCPPDVSVEANSGCNATNVVLSVPLATNDNCGILTVTNNAPASFGPGTNLVTWTVVDPSGNLATCQQKVIVRDTTNPTITCPVDVTVPANSGCSATNVVLSAPLATNDNCGILLVTNNAPASFGPGTNLVVWTVVDTSGNTNTCTQQVVVRDTTNPTITCPTNLVMTADPDQNSRSNVTFTVLATDNCGVPNLVSSPASGSTFPIGVTTVTNTATDASGNQSSCTFLVTVNDISRPGLDVVKACSASPIQPGQNNIVAGTVTNTGNVTLTNVVVTNTIAALGNVSRRVLGPISLAPGKGTNFTDSYTVPLDTCGPYADTLAASASDVAQGHLITDSDTKSCPGTNAPRIFVVKNCPTIPVAPGGVATISGMVSNAGNITLTNVIVYDDQPTNNTLVLGPINLSPGQSVAYSNSFPAPPNCCTYVDLVRATGRDKCFGRLVADNASAACATATTPQLAVTRNCPPLPGTPGQSLVISGVVSNTGNVALTNVIVVSDQPTNNTPVLGPIVLAPGEKANYTTSYLVPLDTCSNLVGTVTAQGRSVCNGVTVSMSQSSSCPIQAAPLLVVTKSCPLNPVSPGGVLLFSGTVSNAGNVTLTNIIIINDHPTNRTPVLGPITLAPRQGTNFSGSYRVCTVCCPPFVDTLTATGAQICNGSNVTATATASCPGVTTPRLDLVVDCPLAPALLGEVLFYSGSVSNAGDVMVSSVLITDNHGGYPAELTGLEPGATADFFSFYLATNCGPGVLTLVTATALDACTGGSVSNQASVACSILCPPTVSPVLIQPVVAGGQCKFSFATELGRTYVVQATDSLRPVTWRSLSTLSGTGGTVTVADSPGTRQRYYRVLVE